MKFIDKYETNIATQKEIKFNKNGTEAIHNQKVFAKTIEKNNKLTYYICTYNGVIYDPIGINSNRENYLNTKMKPVSKNTFDFYMIYLQTNNSIYLTRANRSLLND